MTRSVRVFQVDAFTAEKFCGNPAGVVLDGDDLTPLEMQALARELNNGDTAFVLRPDGDDHDLLVRFFTPRREAAFVGHATVALHAVRADLGLAPCSRQKQRSGIVEVDTISASDIPRIAIHQTPPPLQQPQPPADLEAVLSALALHAGQLDPQIPACIAGDSSKRLLIALAHGETLNAIQPQFSQLSELSDKSGVPGYFLFSRHPAVPDVFTEARMFCPALGIPEDPVSGNAHAMMGTLLAHHGLFRSTDGAASDVHMVEFTGAQGHHMGRPGRVGVALNLVQNQLQSVSIVGEAAIVFSATLQF
jgi:PhzF family phenazine biosynthesis protein